ncbi:MAG TPA: Fe-S cluster assembly protein SufD [Acidobacteriota bacterium]|nr:Fe-S cluster assembly protein SufD [Acidobacteriota bacterium]
MEATAQSSANSDDLGALARVAGEPAWLAQWRRDAWDIYSAAPLPDRVAHLWRYSEPEKFLPDRITPLASNGAAPGDSAPDGLAGNPAAVAVIEDAVLQACWIDPAWHEAGVVLTDLATAAREHEDLVRAHLGTAAGAESGKFEALNAALFAGGLFLYVPRNVRVDKPIHLFQRTRTDLAGLFGRLLIVVDEGAEATLFDEYSNGGENPRVLANSVVEGTLLPNSRLSYFNVQRWGSRTRSHARQRFLVQRDAAVTTVNIGLGGRYNKANLGNVQRGGNAQAEMIGVIFGGGQQHFDNHTEHVHEAGNSFSDMDFKVVLEDEARSVYTGLIRIDLEAPNSEAYQENRNLMLDPTCRAESIPELEILNEEVRCTHGATVGPIDEEQVYYLRTRGLRESEAERLIVEGFFGPALDRIDDDELRERLWGHINAKLAGRD